MKAPTKQGYDNLFWKLIKMIVVIPNWRIFVCYNNIILPFDSFIICICKWIKTYIEFFLYRPSFGYKFEYKYFVCYILVGPSAVRIKYDRKPMSVGKSYKIQCEAIGSKPMASITWWMNNKQVSQSI